MKRINMAILGAGNIARHMAAAINGLQEQVCAYAVASRSLDKAQDFAREWHFQKAYGSYEELAADPEVELIYVATPHAMHYDHARLCVEHGKAVLVEKAFTANADQARQLIQLAEERKVFLTGDLDPVSPRQTAGSPAAGRSGDRGASFSGGRVFGAAEPYTAYV